MTNSPGLSEVGEHETEGGAHSVVVSIEGVTRVEFKGVKQVGEVLRVGHALHFLQSRLTGRVVVEQVQVATAHWRSAGHSSGGVRQVSQELHRRHSEECVGGHVGKTLEETYVGNLLTDRFSTQRPASLKPWKRHMWETC